MIEAVLDRIEQGMSTIDDAQIISAIVVRLMAYEYALREIANDTGEAPQIARRVLTRGWYEPARSKA